MKHELRRQAGIRLSMQIAVTGSHRESSITTDISLAANAAAAAATEGDGR